MLDDASRRMLSNPIAVKNGKLDHTNTKVNNPFLSWLCSSLSWQSVARPIVVQTTEVRAHHYAGEEQEGKKRKRAMTATWLGRWSPDLNGNERVVSTLFYHFATLALILLLLLLLLLSLSITIIVTLPIYETSFFVVLFMQ
jgi:hypothetical protein